jgi:hypothetical protein
MKNQDKFDDLKRDYVTLDDLKQEIIVTLDTHEKIFFRMSNLAWTGNSVLCTSDIFEISKSMPDGKYWITYDYVVTKGKQEFFREDVVCTYKEEIIKLFQSCIEKDDFFNLIMQPTFECEYQFVIKMTEHGYFEKIKNK